MSASVIEEYELTFDGRIKRDPRPQLKVVPKTPDEIEGERITKLAAAKQLRAEIAAAAARYDELRPAHDAIEAEKLDAADVCERVVAPIRTKLDTVKELLLADTVAGRVSPERSHQERRRLEAAIEKETGKLLDVCLPCNERLEPIDAELRTLNATIGKGTANRQTLLDYAEPDHAERMHVASCAREWTERRLAESSKWHQAKPTRKTAAELAAASAAHEAAKAEFKESRRVALEAE